jgi:hypothetical protein
MADAVISLGTKRLTRTCTPPAPGKFAQVASDHFKPCVGGGQACLSSDCATPFSPSRPARGPSARARERASRGLDGCAAARGF